MNAKKLNQLQLYTGLYLSTIIATNPELSEKSEQWTIRNELNKITEQDIKNFDQFNKNIAANKTKFDPNNVEHIRIQLLDLIKSIQKKDAVGLLKHIISETNFDYKNAIEVYKQTLAQLTSHPW